MQDLGDGRAGKRDTSTHRKKTSNSKERESEELIALACVCKCLKSSSTDRL